MDAAVVVATFSGPILAVMATRYLDARAQARARRLDVFRALMGTRRAPLHAEKVRALNMVEIEFHGVADVLAAYGELMRHINTRPANQTEWNERHRSLMTRLLSQIARTLDYRIQQLDVLEGGYYPQGFVDLENEQQEVRRALIEVLQSRRPLTVAQVAPTPATPFPPPPEPETAVGSLPWPVPQSRSRLPNRPSLVYDPGQREQVE